MPKSKQTADPKHPQAGDLHIDASDVDVVDLLAEEIGKLTKLHDGYEEATLALTKLTTAELETLGIDPKDVQQAPALIADIDRVAELSPAADKLSELLRETGYDRGHRLGSILGEAAFQARRRAERNPEAKALLAKIEDLLEYQFGAAKKAVQTKAKNAKAKAEPKNT